MPRKDLVSAKLAAEEKGCTPAAIYAAADRSILTDLRLGGIRLIVRDAKYRAYKVKQTGGRAHKSYVAKQQNEER